MEYLVKFSYFYFYMVRYDYEKKTFNNFNKLLNWIYVLIELKKLKAKNGIEMKKDMFK